MREELWVEVVGYPRYLISDQGRVINRVTGQTMKQVVNASGYMTVSISSGRSRAKTFSVPKLVWTCFGRKVAKPDVIRHRDGDKTNNALSNLYLTYRTRPLIRVRNIDTGEEFETMAAAARSVGETTDRFGFAIRQPGRSVSGHRFEIIED